MGVCDVLPRLPLLTLQAQAPAHRLQLHRLQLHRLQLHRLHAVDLDSELSGLYKESCL